MATEFVRLGAWMDAELDFGRVRIIDLDEGQDGPWDVEVSLRDRRRFVATVASLEDITRLMANWRESGECLNGRYLWIRSLVIVESLTPSLIADVVADLLRTGELNTAFEEVDPEID
jgi:hypothetical protein